MTGTMNIRKKRWSSSLKTWLYPVTFNGRLIWVTIPGDDTPKPENVLKPSPSLAASDYLE